MRALAAMRHPSLVECVAVAWRPDAGGGGGGGGGGGMLCVLTELCDGGRC
jgi:hypothetical protein